jgi:AraC-like DNA-binding protein
MEYKEIKKEQPRILYACYHDRSLEGETFIANHVFSYIISGTQEMWLGNKMFSFKAGDYRFFTKNQLAKYVKKPSAGEFKSISVHIDQATLLNMSNELDLQASVGFNGDKVLLLKPNEYFSTYIDSLSPYTRGTDVKNKKLTLLKVKELILVLLETNPNLKDILFDFSVPGKIDLEAFMNEHYRYNIELSRFAFLTGRSLSTFKRDFEKIFNLTPNKWLVRKRLDEAYYLIKERQKKPTEIYLGLGFEDISHFSFAFKKAFGITPNQL